MSSGLLNRSTSRISKSMPFSNNTSRQRWENGHVVPEYRTILFAFPQKAEGPARRKPPRTGFFLAPAPHPVRCVYLISFQYAAFSRQAKKLKRPRNSRTHTPSCRRLFCVGSAIHDRNATRSATAES